MIRTNRYINGLILTLSSTLASAALVGCGADEGISIPQEDVSESAEALGVPVPSCSTAASSGYNTTTSNLAIAMTGSTPNVVIGVVSGYVTVNGYPCVKPTAAGGGKLTPSAVKKITITGTAANNEKVVLDLLSGSFGATVFAATGGMTIDLGTGTGDMFSIRGTGGVDKWTIGENSSNLYWELSGDTTADLKVVAADSVSISLSGGNDTLTARGGTITATHLAGGALTTLAAVSSALTVNAGDGDDTITGGNGNDVLNGAAGNDIFKTHSAADGDDTVNGGAGTDKMDYTGRTAVLTVTMDGATNSGEGAEADLIGPDMEDLVGGGNNDVLTGNTLANHIQGGGGDDTISGGPAGACNADVDVLDGEAGNDKFDMGAAGDCGDTVNGNAGVDIVDYQGRGADLVITVDGNANDGPALEKDNIKTDVEVVIGGSGNDNITGSANDDEIHGGPGTDTINGGAGNDTLTGNSGTDTLNGEAGDDTFDESGVDAYYTVAENKGDGNDVMNGGSATASGMDKVSYAARTAVVSASICMDSTKPTGASTSLNAQCTDADGEAGETDKIINVTHLVGGDDADVLKGHTGDDRLEGGAGNDTLYGGAGNDWLFGDDDDDTMYGDAGDDHLDGVAGTDVYDGDNVSNLSDGDVCMTEGAEVPLNCEL